jgi:hypothetical protein
MKVHHIIAALIAVYATAVSAQTLSAVKVDSAAVKVGDTVKATAMLDVEGNTINCGMRINWGDGAVSDNKINQAQDVPMVATHQYAKPGTYTVMAEPKRVGSVLKCAGKNQSVNVVVAAPAPAPVAAAPAAAAPAAAAPVAAAKAGDTCPAGWKLAKPGVNKKTKSFTCTAKANTKLPDDKVACPGDLTYFENAKKGQLGCRV